MKKGYKKLLFFEIVLFCLLFINSFVWNILSDYFILIFLLMLIVLFKFVFGFEKDRHRFTKDLILEIIIFLIVFFILFYLLGIFITFAKTGNFISREGLIHYIIPTFGYIILREIFRYGVMSKAQGNKLVIVMTILLFIFLDISTTLYYADFSSNYKILTFVGLTLLPAVSSNIVFSYITLKTGYKPIILYASVMGLYQYVLPIIPNPDEYLSSIIRFLLPVVLCYRIYGFFHNNYDKELEREYRKKSVLPLAVVSLVVCLLVYFTSGYFHYWAIAIATGSMDPVIKKGDVAIVKKIDDNYHQLKVGDVIAFRYQNVVIVHRIINIVQDRDKYYFYTKGDANVSEDKFAIESDMIVGVVNHKIPLIGIPTVWLSELS